MAERGGVGTRLYVAGGTEVRREFDATGDAGKRMFAQIAAGERSANPALRALSVGVGEVRQGVTGLADDAGAAGRFLGSFGAAGVVAAAGVAAVGVAVQQARAAIAFADEIADSAQRVNVSAEALQQYRYAIQQVGGEAGDADTALANFTKNLGLAESGLSPKVLKAFQSLGFSQDELRSFNDADEALTAVIGRVSALSKESERAAIADKIGIKELLPLAREGADRLAELRQEASDLGYVMSNEVAAKGSEAADKLDALSQVIKVQMSGAFIELAPTILGATEALADFVKEFGDIARDPSVQNSANLLGEILAAYSRGPFAPLGVAARGIKSSIRDAKMGALPANFGVDPDDPDQIRYAMIAARDRPSGGGNVLNVPARGRGGSRAKKDTRTSLGALDTSTEVAFDPRTGQDLNYKAIQDQLDREAVGYFKEEKKQVDLSVDIDPARSFQKLNEQIDASSERLHDGVYDALHAAFSGDIGDFIKNKLMSWALEGLTNTLTGGLQAAGSRGGIWGTIASAAMSAFGGGFTGGGASGGKGGFTANRRAAGGTEWAGDFTSKGEFGPELSISGRAGQVFDADTTRRILGLEGGQGGGGGGGHTVNFSPTINAPGADRQGLADLRADMQRMAAGIPDLIDQRSGPSAHDYLQRAHVLPQTY